MFSRILKGSAIALLALLMLAPMVSAQRGRVIIGGGFGFGGFYGPGWYGYGYPYYWGGPYGYYYNGGPTAGEVKLTAPAKTDLVFVDGAYAGLAGKMKHFNLPAGNHNIELRDPSGNSLFQEKIDVIRGKTIDVGS
jgi:hypothetical protein